MKYKGFVAIILTVLILLTVIGCSPEQTVTDTAVTGTDSIVSDTESIVSNSNSVGSSVVQSTTSETVSETASETLPPYELEKIEIEGISEQKMNEILALSSALTTWGPGLKFDRLNRPSYAVSAQEQYGKLGARYIMGNSNEIYLTFDEGYENGNTPRILDTLKEKEVKAVFFVTLSFVKNNPDLIKRMINEGHIVGNHSTNHFSYPTKSLNEVYEDFIKLHNYMVDNFDYEMKLFRFPMGQHSEQTLALLKELGYESVFWSFAYVDWDTNAQPDPNEAFDTIVGRCHPGAILLLHAVSRTNTEILGNVIDKLREDHYVFTPYPVNQAEA